MTEAIPAATLVLFRCAAGAAEHLFVERAATMAFAAGAMVFPGGKVDLDDYALAARFPDLDPDDAAARIAAIRETVEETGVGAGLSGDTDAATIAALRRHLHDGAVFSDVLAALKLELALERLVPFARWRPNFRETRIFDARFYLAELADNAAPATVDETENARLFWASAQAVLDQAAEGAVSLIFPTRRNLERLAQFADFSAARAQAEAIAPEMISPWIEHRDGAPHLCIPTDRGYPVCAEPITSARRG